MHTSQPHNRYGEIHRGRERKNGRERERERERERGERERERERFTHEPYLTTVFLFCFRFSKHSSSHRHEHVHTSQRNATHGKKSTMEPEQVVSVMFHLCIRLYTCACADIPRSALPGTLSHYLSFSVVICRPLRSSFTGTSRCSRINNTPYTTFSPN